MKKLVIAILMFFSFSSIATAEVGAKIGISGNLGVFEGKANETENGEKNSDRALGVAGYASIFLEKSLPGAFSRLSIGIDYVPTALESETVSESRSDSTVAAVATGEQKSQVDFEDLTTMYLSLNVTDNFYIKTGMVQVDAITNEKLHTGSTYGNQTIDGTMYGAGYHKDLDNGAFWRVEGNVMQFDKATFTSQVVRPNGTTAAQVANVIVLEEFNGANAKISIGKSF
ncbi:hypothetical protein N8824_03815 [Candidatus Pelagibacter sp.]|nr:hypothetical protein [Candidatus Pelagibacter sp.]